MKAWQHFKTITKHKLLVMDGCFRVGLIRQGLLHDPSKYSPTEFRIGARYYQGNKSPNAAERACNLFCFVSIFYSYAIPYTSRGFSVFPFLIRKYSKSPNKIQSYHQ